MCKSDFPIRLKSGHLRVTLSAILFCFIACLWQEGAASESAGNQLDDNKHHSPTTSDIQSIPPTASPSRSSQQLDVEAPLEYGIDLPPFEDLVAIEPYSKLVDPDSILASLARDDSVTNVIVTLWQPERMLNVINWDSRSDLAQVHSATAALEDAVLTLVDASQVTVRHRYENFAGFSCATTYDGLAALLQDPLVRHVEPVRTLRAHTKQGSQVINAQQTQFTYDGNGVSVAIVDTGVDYNHGALGHNAAFPNEKVIGGWDFGDDDPDPAAGDTHGTNCAGIAAGYGSLTPPVGDYAGGIARGAKIYALKITQGHSDITDDDAIWKAWDWCVTHKNDDPNNPILVISTSFGGGQHFSTCDMEFPACTLSANNAVSAGITVLASSGNDGYCDALSSPACISSVISVGAVYDAAFGDTFPCVSGDSCVAIPDNSGSCDSGHYTNDVSSYRNVPSYSNSAPFLDLLASADNAYTTQVGGGFITNFNGTSAACPYAAGAVVLLQTWSKHRIGRYLTPDEVRQTLVANGTPITDPKSNVTTPLVNVGKAVATIGEEGSYLITATASGRGSISPNGDVFVPLNTNKTFSMITVQGNAIEDVLVDGQSVGPRFSYTFSSVSSHHSIHAKFSGSVDPVITATANGDGVINPEGSVTVPITTNKTFSFIKNAGASVEDVLVDGQSIGPRSFYTFSKVLSNHSIHVEFSSTGPDPDPDPDPSSSPCGTVDPGDIGPFGSAFRSYALLATLVTGFHLSTRSRRPTFCSRSVSNG